ncbi:MAG: hypothetical protein WAO02_01145 [Verrucomicrobiia bacterium]
MQATRDGGSSSASRFTLVGPARLSSGRSADRSTLRPNVSPKAICQIAKRLAILLAVALTGCDSGWTGVHKEAGPLPLSSPDMPIVRLVDKRRTFEQGEIKRLLWDEGKGPILAEDRVKPLLDSIPKELNDRLHSTRNVPAKLYQPLRDTGDTGTTYEYIYDTWGIVVSLNPDVLIVSVHETPVGPHSRLPRSWDELSIDQARRENLNGRIEFITGGVELVIYAGTLVPWSKEMYIFSTDPKVESGRMKFENNQATILLPTGKLVLVHHDDDVDVRRE